MELIRKYKQGKLTMRDIRKLNRTYLEILLTTQRQYLYYIVYYESEAIKRLELLSITIIQFAILQHSVPHS